MDGTWVDQALSLGANKWKIACTLEWRGSKRYFENSSIHWSPWLSNFGIKLDTLCLIEVARKLNNKGLHHLKDLWDEERQWWTSIEALSHRGFRSLNERVLLNQLFDKLKTQHTPPCTLILQWGHWKWLRRRPLWKLLTKLVYARLASQDNWAEVQNKV